MKTSFLIASAILLSAVSCQTLDQRICTGKKRSETYAGSSGPFIKEDRQPPGADNNRTDTCLYFCAVDFDNSYDWHRDSCCGNAEAEIILFRDFLPIIRIRTGEAYCIGTDPATHHLMDGHLYTEYTNATHTVIKKNGEEVIRYPGREVLKGLIDREGQLWTLGQDKKGEGFTLRCNGDVIFRKNEGIIFGDLAGSTHPGLYEDNGKICFCYSSGSDFYPNLFIVRDGAESQTQAPDRLVCDMLLFKSRLYILSSDASGQNLKLQAEGPEYPISLNGITVHQAGLFENNGSINVLFNARNSNGDCSVIWKNPDIVQLGNCSAAYVYPVNGELNCVTVRDELIKCSMHGSETVYVASGAFLFNRFCAAFPGDSFFLALSPRKAGECPSVLHNRESVPVEINGYISGLEVCLTEREEEK